MWNPESVVLLSGSGGSQLAEEIAGIIGLPASSSVSASSSVKGECQIQLGSNVRGRQVFVIQSTGDPVNDHIIELALILSACKRASAARVHAIVPYLAYGRQTRKAKSRVPVSAADLAAILEEACVDAVVTVDIHDEQIAGFYSPRCAFHNLDYIRVAARLLVRQGLNSPVVVAPHSSTVTRAMAFVNALVEFESELGTWAPRRHPSAPSAGQTAAAPPPAQAAQHVEALRASWKARTPSVAMLLTVERHGVREQELTGDVAGRDVVLVDDIVDSGNTLSRASKQLIERGASRVFAFATHGLLSSDAADRIAKAPIELLVVTNTLPTVIAQLSPEHRLRRKVVVLSVAPMLAHYICEHADLPSPDFDPLIPTYAMHGGSAPASPAFPFTLGASMDQMSLDADSLLSDVASVTESQTTASEFSANYS